MKKNWIFQNTEISEVETNNLREALSCPYKIAKLLLKKGISTEQEALDFFHPDEKNFHDPFLFADMEKSVEKIIRAIHDKDKIIIFGDYDVDGTSATAILLLGLGKLGANVDFYIPNRMVGGYGLSAIGNEELKKRGAKLVITVDCGIDAVKAIQDLNQSKIDVIVTDHHTPKKNLPDAFAIINPKLENSKYPYLDLSGAGVAYKLLDGVYSQINDKNISITDFLDFASLGTIADIVPLSGENRIFASLGIKKMSERKNLGLKVLMNLAGLKTQKLKSTDIVFKIAPRINAAGRMGSADRAVKLFTSTISEEAQFLAETIHKENQKRQQIDKKTFNEACAIIESKYPDMENTYFIVLESDSWHSGIIGIVASKIVEKYNRPTILITFANGEGSGSGRSIPGFNIFECLLNFKEYLINFGGHKYAVGLSILPEYINIFEEKLNQFAKEKLSTEDIRPQIPIAEELQLQEIDTEFMSWLKKFAPFGPKNMNPIFASKKVMVVGYPYIVGTNHLKIKTKQNGNTLGLIGFNMGEVAHFLKKGTYIDIAYSLEENEWNNNVEIQGKLKDILPHQK
ncbi:MAG: single-stranded-DNA-specific exonuclease RecJ [Candidatus Cloacimonetes bacterium]|nr:single-stranded-DNA-specific exonuclease RecJ [Candidatus Cloacimonadota bacterium]